MSVQVGYLLRIGYWFWERCENYRGPALSDPIIVDPQTRRKWKDPVILGYCDVQDEDTPELIRDLQDARKYWRAFAERGIPTMLLEVAYPEGSPSELANYEPKQGTLLGFDAAVLAGNFESLVMDWVIRDRWFDNIEKSPEYPLWQLIKAYFRLRLTDSGLLRSAEDALLLTGLEEVIFTFIIKDWRDPRATPCCVVLIEDFPDIGNHLEWPGFIDPKRFSDR